MSGEIKVGDLVTRRTTHVYPRIGLVVGVRKSRIFKDEAVLKVIPQSTGILYEEHARHFRKLEAKNNE